MGNSQPTKEDVLSGIVVKEACSEFSETLAHPDYPGVLKKINKGC